ncbi:tRNA lysidine(34) synthetase TilS [Aurantiacibacter sp. D1-12]|uniref:tRNA lysidine(34) synthetase TilS n=1 Tax=Aurantiacibacter sp. D1-12 TaxID=2993658 RepID=UPI00237C90BB|nr:tRNA lysidine(34) synthetase TilS [Aurantiacibacter sp. D1-12]MDE1467124.1 tRNA lysidine(34) synthetase TilS [Aurantiacibacter sp. D1-12]
MGASTAIDPELVARFKKALDRLNPDGGKLGLAVSGGPDSMAMLLLAQETIPGQFEVATVDHGLRPEAKDECALVVAACEERGVPCEVLSVTVGEGNVQAKAREARYEALGDWLARKSHAAVATAHHADDQAETVLMRLNRGSGLAGLAGIRERTVVSLYDVALDLIRPLLSFRRIELETLVRGSKVSFVDDPSNADLAYERVRVRQRLGEASWLDPTAIAHSAQVLGEAAGAMEAWVRVLWHERMKMDKASLRFRPTRLAYIDRELAVRAIRVRTGKSVDGGDVARLVDRLQGGENANLSGVLVTVEGDDWVFRPEPPRRTG